MAAKQSQTDTTKLSLKEKLHQVYELITKIEKKGENTSQHYKYIRAADVTNAIRSELTKLRVYAEINFDFDGPNYTIARAREVNAPFAAVNVKCSIVFHDLDSSETKTSSGLGSGADTGDKAAYKAQTGALKYALKNAFLVPDEEDPEADSTTDEGSGPRGEMPDFQDAKRGTPTPSTPKGPKQATPKPKGDVPIASQPTEASSTPSQASPSSATAAAAPSTTSAAPAAAREPGEEPTATAAGALTEEELAVYRKKFRDLGDDLTTTGKLKASRGLPVNRKVLVFLLSITKAPDASKITKAQWEDFFQRVDAKRAAAEGMIGLAALVNKANGIDEKAK